MPEKETVESLKQEIDEMSETLTEIYNIVNGSDEKNWRNCMEEIQRRCRRHI